MPSHLLINSFAIKLSVRLCFNKSFAFLVASASTSLLSASSFAFSNFCSATCLSSIALLYSSLKLKLVMLKLSIVIPYFSTFFCKSSKQLFDTSALSVITSAAVYLAIVALILSLIAGSNIVAS